MFSIKLMTHAVAVTGDSASNIDIAAKTLHILQHGCFTHVFNPAAQNIYTVITVSMRPS